MKIVVGVDGSDPAGRAVDWCAEHALALGAEVVAVFSIDMPVFAASGFGSVPLPVPSEPDRAELREKIQHEWCAALSKADVPFTVVVTDGPPAPAIMAIAQSREADLVVTGRRGRGGFAELVMGSTSHQLSHHLDRPLVIVP